MVAADKGRAKAGLIREFILLLKSLPEDQISRRGFDAIARCAMSIFAVASTIRRVRLQSAQKMSRPASLERTHVALNLRQLPANELQIEA